MAKRKAATFGQDLMRGEHVVGGGKMTDGAKKKGLGGVTMSSFSSHPRYYEQKIAAEKKLGRKLSNEEFEAEHWNLPADSELASGTSIFDPVLCELAYSWFSPAGGVVLDPFAGGSVRGIVASRLGRRYVGVELRPEQVSANIAQGEAICPENAPTWHVGDSRKIDEICAGVEADFVFSCPPYADLEVYSDRQDDLSTMDYADFLAAYREIIAKSCALLKDDRFACFVVGEVRDKAGNYRNFVGDTVEAFRAAGLSFYNEAILVTAVGSLPIRVGKQFAASRKIGKTHQNVLVFVKGDGARAAATCGSVEVQLPDDGEHADLGEQL